MGKMGACGATPARPRAYPEEHHDAPDCRCVPGLGYVVDVRSGFNRPSVLLVPCAQRPSDCPGFGELFTNSNEGHQGNDTNTNSIRVLTLVVPC
jgi:hypothetical protein